MASDKAADADDALRLELLQCGGEIVDAGQVGAVGAAARDQARVAVDQQRRASVLHDGNKCFGAVDLRALVRIGKAQQHGGDIARAQDRRKLRGKCGCLRDRRRHQVEARRRARFGLFGSRSHGPRMVAQSGGKLTSI